MKREEIEAEARLMAIEYQLCHVYNMVLKMIGVSEEDIAHAEKTGVRRMDGQPIGTADPAMSDHVLGEFQDALSRLQDEARLMRQVLKAQ
ncbi:hypothetical protein [Rhizobium laguerreae]|uniref:hypothetical protein n=1 Tax=Rhizobium laguerreae TaxID=1076926 RepID=UPI001C8FEF71|nr:hypothetical protein [Rhizobium laguerreae]MBY3382224.1 hypothetical protein [Rhizobium laguerreae]